MAFLAHYLVRSDDLCPGITKCPGTREVTCRETGNRWRPPDIRDPGLTPCPYCESKLCYRKERCADCELAKFETAMSSSLTGSILERAAELDYQLHKGFTISPAQIDSRVYRAMRAIDTARHKLRKEEERQRRQGG